MDFRPPTVSSTLLSEAPTWNPLQHLSLSTEKRWAETCKPEFPNFTLPVDDERTKFEAKSYNRKDDPTNRMYTAPVAFSTPAAPFRKTIAFKSLEEIDIELATVEATKLMTRLPSVPKILNAICPLEEILGTDNDGYKVGAANSLVASKEPKPTTVPCAASENLTSLTTVDIANAIVAIAPIFNEYYQIFLEHQCDGNLVAKITQENTDMMIALFSSWGITNSIHRSRIAQAFNEWRNNPPKTMTPREMRQVKLVTASDTYGTTLQKAGILASEIPAASKTTSLNIDQHFSHFKRLSLQPLTKTPSSKSVTCSVNLTNEASSEANVALAHEDTSHSYDLSVKYRIPRDKISVNSHVVPERDVSASECIANRLSSSQIASDFEKTAATIRHFIESPLVSDGPIIQGDDSRSIGCDLQQTNGAQETSKPKKIQVPSYDTSPNVYSRPNLPVNRFLDASAQKVAVKHVSSSTNAIGPIEELTTLIHGSDLDKVKESSESNMAKVDMLDSNLEAKSVSSINTSPKTGESTKPDLSPKKARQVSPKLGHISNRVLVPKIKAEAPTSFQRPASATHHVVWIDKNDEEEDQMDASFETETCSNEATRAIQTMTVKTPLTIYLNAADKNFRPTKSKYNAGLQLIPLRQTTEGPASKFDSKQRSAGLRFRERTASASVTGLSASGVQFNPVSALFRSKRWKSCSNYHLFTTKLKASKDLQRFARSATTPRFKVAFNDENSIIRCIVSSRMFALHFVIAAKYDDLGELQPQSYPEEASTDTFFWTGLSE